MLTFERVEELQCTFRGLREQRGADLSQRAQLIRGRRDGGSAAGSAAPEPVDTAPAGCAGGASGSCDAPEWLLAPMLALAAQHSPPWLRVARPLGAPPAQQRAVRLRAR